MTRLSATTGISNRGAQLATLSCPQFFQKAAVEFTRKADIGAIGRSRPRAAIRVAPKAGIVFTLNADVAARAASVLN